MFQARSLKCIYVYFDFDCTPKFECYGARIANATISPVSWASHEPLISQANKLISLENHCSHFKFTLL